MKIDVIAVDRLIPYARNAKLHNDSQIAAIAGSIREFGFNNPVLIDADDGIIAGHGRVLAARLLGINEVPCIRLSHLTDNQKRAYIIADNKTQMLSGFDEDMLEAELGELLDAGIDPASFGFSEADIDMVFGDLASPDEAGSPLDAGAAMTYEERSSQQEEQDGKKEKTIYPLLIYLDKTHWNDWVSFKKTRMVEDNFAAFKLLIEAQS